ncbi:MAG TPA: YdeI/OmpD-associated family protein [Verrucomicrobiae bacterium]|nr:YdeI/OmpD-associated family protein [Verrucomicrobiae bacterium]
MRRAPHSADDAHIFSARIYKQWIMRCVDVPRDVSKSLCKLAGDSPKHIPVHGQVEGLPLKSTLSPRGGGAYRLHIHSNIWRKLRIDAGATVEVMLFLDSEPRDPVLPHDLAGGLADEPRALAIFNSLTPALRRQIVRYVDQAKHATTRDKRVRLIVKRMLERADKRRKKKNA